MAITPIKRESIIDQVYEQLKDNLLDGTWKPGDKIPSENELSEAFGISRVSVRQALARLAALGLIETRLGEGSYVCELGVEAHMQELIPYVLLGEDSIRELAYFRYITEPEYAVEASLKGTPEQLKELRRIAEDSASHWKQTTKDRDYTARVDAEFHSYIANLTGNNMVIQLNHIVQKLAAKNFAQAMLNYSASGEGSDNDHVRIVEAMEKKDEALIRSCVKEHFRRLMDQL